MSDGNAQPLRREREAGHRRRDLDRVLAAFAGAGKRLLAGGPGERTRATDCDAVDPTMFAVAGDDSAHALRVGCRYLAVVAAGDHAIAVAGGAEDGSLMHRNR